MIAHVIGKVVEKFGSSVIVDVNGVGYEVSVPAGDFETALLETTTKFYTHHHVREQTEELFGFSTLAAKKIFELLISVQGIGPKAALAILSLGTAEHVRNAIANSDSTWLSGASGVGKKTAERVVVDLHDKVGLPTYYNTGSAAAPIQVEIDTSDEALEALIALGYTLADATKALDGIDTTLDTSTRVREALKGKQ